MRRWAFFRLAGQCWFGVGCESRVYSMRNVFFSCLMLFSGSCLSEVATRDNLVVKQLHPSSNNRLGAPEYNGLTRVYFEAEGDWGNTDCRKDAADVMEDDKNISSHILAAFMADKEMMVEVNDALPRVSGVCKVTAIFVKK